jgi:hypothetical protein
MNNSEISQINHSNSQEPGEEENMDNFPIRQRRNAVADLGTVFAALGFQNQEDEGVCSAPDYYNCDDENNHGLCLVDIDAAPEEFQEAPRRRRNAVADLGPMLDFFKQQSRTDLENFGEYDEDGSAMSMDYYHDQSYKDRRRSFGCVSSPEPSCDE